MRMLTDAEVRHIRAESLIRAERRLKGLTPRELRQWALRGLIVQERAKIAIEMRTEQKEEVHGG